jgi:hypothetical protein
MIDGLFTIKRTAAVAEVVVVVVLLETRPVVERSPDLAAAAAVLVANRRANIFPFFNSNFFSQPELSKATRCSTALKNAP